MASISEYEQQQFWKNPVDIRIKYKYLYDIITYRLEQAFHQTMIKQSNKSILPERYISGIDPYDINKKSNSYGK